MIFLIFLAALSASILAFELVTSFQPVFASFGTVTVWVVCKSKLQTHSNQYDHQSWQPY
jgi:hypothetical protein